MSTPISVVSLCRSFVLCPDSASRTAVVLVAEGQAEIFAFPLLMKTTSLGFLQQLGPCFLPQTLGPTPLPTLVSIAGETSISRAFCVLLSLKNSKMGIKTSHLLFFTEIFFRDLLGVRLHIILHLLTSTLHLGCTGPP